MPEPNDSLDIFDQIRYNENINQLNETAMGGFLNA